MLDVSIDIKGDKVVIDNLQTFTREMPRAVQRGLANIGREVHREAFANLSGPAGDTGGYPVPVVTGTARRLLSWLNPGESKSVGELTVSAGDFEVIIYDSAVYADVLHDGTGSSAAYGPREYLFDAVETLDRSFGILGAIEEEIAREQRRTM